MNSYRILANDISHRKLNIERGTKLEILIADLQLFGNKEQIELAKKLANVIAKGEDFDLDPLLNNLGNDLRKRLDLDSVEGNVQWIRIGE